MSIDLILYLLAFVSFVCGFFNAPRFNWIAGGLAMITLTFLV